MRCRKVKFALASPFEDKQTLTYEYDTEKTMDIRSTPAATSDQRVYNSRFPAPNISVLSGVRIILLEYVQNVVQFEFCASVNTSKLSRLPDSRYFRCII